MFGLFKTSRLSAKVVDKVWLTRTAKYKACRQMLERNPACVFFVWFEETYRDLHAALGNTTGVNDQIHYAGQPLTGAVEGKMIVFAEHHPLSAKEQQVFSSLRLAEVPVLSALDEPSFRLFGGDRTVEILKKLGAGENDVIAHSLVSKSIARAQQKVAAKTRLDHPARSQQEWLSSDFGTHFS